MKRCYDFQHLRQLKPLRQSLVHSVTWPVDLEHVNDAKCSAPSQVIGAPRIKEAIAAP